MLPSVESYVFLVFYVFQEDANQKKPGSDVLDKAMDIAEKEVAIVQDREKEREKKMVRYGLKRYELYYKRRISVYYPII